MTGIYKITNLINKKIYIGCSSNIEVRWKNHIKRAFHKNKEYNKSLYIDFRKYGIDNFKFEIIEETELENLYERERYYIITYNAEDSSIGYNIKYGEENHRNVKLTKEDVIDIRTRYNNKERKKYVYYDYKNKINETGFHKIWNFETWKNIMPEVHTQENINFHKNNTANKGSENGTSKVTEQDVIAIRTAKKEGKNKKIFYENFKDKLSYKSYCNIWYNCNWKHVII